MNAGSPKALVMTLEEVGSHRNYRTRIILLAVASRWAVVESDAGGNGQPTKFLHHGWIRPVYFTILISHVILAVAIVPLVITTLVRAFKGQKADDYSGHRKIARWVWPIWIYVSVTGVLVYLLLYVWYPSPQ